MRRLAVMCSAIFRRITLIGTDWPARPAPLAALVGAGRATAGAAGLAADGEATGAAALSAPPTTARMSSLVTRPAMPVP